MDWIWMIAKLPPSCSVTHPWHHEGKNQKRKSKMVKQTKSLERLICWDNIRLTMKGRKKNKGKQKSDSKSNQSCQEIDVQSSMTFGRTSPPLPCQALLLCMTSREYLFGEFQSTVPAVSPQKLFSHPQPTCCLGGMRIRGGLGAVKALLGNRQKIPVLSTLFW